jgi:gamma-glutamyltranspeptidase/glutathione hydrolase
MRGFVYLSIVFVLFFSCRQEKSPKGEIAQNAMVVSARQEASEIGIQILKKGGNAFDAMIATEMALNVSYPFAGSIGGGGFMVFRTNDGKIGSLDYREKAPMAAHRDMYLDSTGQVIPGLSTQSALAIGVPGTIADMFEVHDKYGTLPIKDILKPVIQLAKKGIVVTKKQAQRLKKYQKAFISANNDSIPLSYDWKKNDTITNMALASTLERISKYGKDDFYKGKTAEILVKFIQSKGGIITPEDLENYRAKWRKPITFKYDDLKVISMSPPSSGGICLAQIMNGIEKYDIDKFGHNNSKSIQVIVEAERRAYADRSHFLGDPDFVEIPVERLMNKAYMENRMKDFSFDKATKSKDISYGNIEIVESQETTHYSIVDQFGNAVSATVTLNGAYGSKLYVLELGFFLNNEMDDFSSKPGVPNMFGLIGAKANQIAPEKRMLSSMTPTIIEKEGDLYMVLGSPGGSTIITSVLQTILNVHEYEMGMQEAVDQPRFHHQWLPDEILLEPDVFDRETKKALENSGYHISEKESAIIGKVNAILVLPGGELEGGADPRGDEKAVGY